MERITAQALRYPLAHVTYGPEEIAAVLGCLEAGQTTCGARVSEFEAAFAARVGAPHGIMVNSGSSADLLLAYSLGLPDTRNEVLIPAVTWPTQVSSCLNAGYRVRLVDVDPNTLQFDADDLESKISTKTAAIFPAHILGNVGDMDTLLCLAQDSGAGVLEDCCEALGSTWKGKHVGTLGHASAFSFFFSHLLNTMEGGMVVCTYGERNYRLMRAHGWEPQADQRFHFPRWGFNLRPTELQGAFGLAQLAKLDTFIAARALNFMRLSVWTADRYPEFLSTPQVFHQCSPAWHGFPLMVAPTAPFTRQALCQYLDDHAVETRPIVAGNLARQPAVRGDSRVICGHLPGADIVDQHGFYIGLASYDDHQGTAYVAEVLEAFMRQVAA